MSRKIAIVIPGFQASPDDWCIPVFTNLARELSKYVELHVYPLRYPHRRDRYNIGKVRVHSLGAGAVGGKRLPGVSLLKLWLEFISEVQREHRRSPFAAILGIWATESGWLATRAARRVGVPSFVHLAGGELTRIPQIRYGNFGQGLAGRLVSSSLAAADVLTVPSEPLMRKLASLPGVERSRIRRWAPGVDTEMFSPASDGRARENTFVFVTTGSLIPVKGHDLLLRALAELRQHVGPREVRLRVVGDGPRGTLLRKMVSALDLEGYVTFEGEVSHEALPEIYRQSDAFVLGSWHEAQCMAALEAMACGLPWVGPPVGALWDVAALSGHTPSGTLFLERNAILVAEAMKRVVDLAPMEIAHYARSARRCVLEAYSLSVQTRKLWDLVGGLTECGGVAYHGKALPSSSPIEA